MHTHVLLGILMALRNLKNWTSPLIRTSIFTNPLQPKSYPATPYTPGSYLLGRVLVRLMVYPATRLGEGGHFQLANGCHSLPRRTFVAVGHFFTPSFLSLRSLGWCKLGGPIGGLRRWATHHP